jgi:hypothetical protein
MTNLLGRREKDLENEIRGNWNVLKIIQTIPEQHTGKALNQGATENSHLGHCTHTAEGDNVKLHNKFHGHKS